MTTAEHPEPSTSEAHEEPAAEVPAAPESGWPAGYSRPLPVIARCLALSALIGVSLAIWFVFSFGRAWVVPFLAGNELPMPDRMALIKTTIGAAAVGVVIGTALLVVFKRKGFGLPALERLLWFLCPLLVFPFLPQLFRFKPWVDHQDVLVVLVLVVALFAEVLVFQSLGAVPERVRSLLERAKAKLPAKLKQHGPMILVLTATAAYVAFMSFYNIRWHHKLKTHNFDLSIDNNLIYSALKGAHLQSTVTLGDKAGQYLATHAKLGQYVILPIYALYPKPETLIVIQSALLGLGALPLFGLARRRISDWAAAILCLAYLAYVPLHGANFTESKYLSLSGFFVISTFWAIDRKKWVLFGLAFLAATLMREDVPIGLAVGGTFLLLTGHRPRIGLGMAVVSTVWFVILRFLIMDRAGSWWFPEMYKGLWAAPDKGFGSVIKTLLTNPLFVLNKVAEKDKVLYLLHLFTPLVFLPVRRWYLWLLFLPGAVLTLLVTDYKPIIGFSFQYVMHWVPYLFMAAPLALAAITRESEDGPRRARAALVAVGLASAALSYNYGAFARRPESVKGGYFYIDFTYTPEERRRYAELLQIIAKIPKDASVVATENVGPHVSSRRYMYGLRRGVYDAEYMLAARNELDFEQTRKLFTDSVKSGKYGVVDRVGDFVLLKKAADPSGNAQLAADWKL